MSEIVLTHTGKLGDFILMLPIGSWFYKSTGKKIHWVLPKCVPGFDKIDTLLYQQEMTSRISYINFMTLHYNMGGQPFIFDPRNYGIKCDVYYNLGYKSRPNKYAPAFVAEQIGLDYDRDFILDIGEKIEKTDEILCTNEELMKFMPPDAKLIDFKQKILYNLKRMQAARLAHAYKNAGGVMLSQANIPFILWRTRRESYSYRIFIKNLDNIISEVVIDNDTLQIGHK